MITEIELKKADSMKCITHDEQPSNTEKNKI